MTFKKRHAKANEQHRDYRPCIVLTREEWEKVKTAAHALKMSVSDWMISRANRQKKI